MTFKKRFMAAGAGCAALMMPAHAHADPGMIEAENIRKLDIMLMVTSLRCRTGEHDFQAEYRTFSRNNLSHLNRAGEKMRTNIRAQYGNRGSKRALDRLSVQMANTYGNGHPWLECAELKQVASDLGNVMDHASLALAASKLLGPQRVALTEVP